MAGQKGHRFDEGLDDKEVVLVLRIGKFQAVAEFGDAMLDLDTGVDFHEVVAVAVDDTFEGRGRIETDGETETGRFLLHPLQHVEIALQGLDFGFFPGRLGLGNRRRQPFLGHGDFEEFLLMHLQGAVAAAERDTPFAVTEELDLIVAGLLDIELDENVLVVADAVGLDLVEDFAHQRRRFRRRLEDHLFIGILGGEEGAAENTLSLAATAADRLDAEAAARMLAEEFGNLDLHLGAKLIDRVKIDPLGVGSHEDMIGEGLQREVGILEQGLVADQPFGIDEFDKIVAGRVLLEQGPGGDVVDAGGDADIDGEGGAFRFVLLAGARLGPGTGADKLEPGRFDRRDEFFVFGHETVAGKDRIVVVIMSDTDDLIDALDALFLARPGVIGDAVDTARIGELAQFRSQGIRIDDGVLLGEEDAEVLDPHLGVDIHRLFADRAAADDEGLEIFASKGTDPLGGRLAQPAIAMDQRIMRIIFRSVKHRSLSPV